MRYFIDSVNFVVLVIGFVLALSAARVAVAHQCIGEAGEDVQDAIAEARQRFIEAYNTRDLDSMIGLFHKDAYFAGTEHPFWMEGSDAISSAWQAFFGTFPNLTIIYRQPCVRAFDGFTVETGYLQMFMGDGTNLPLKTNARYSITRQNTDGQWLIVNLHVSELTD